MSKLKQALNFFVTIESEEGDEVPAEAASEDVDVAAEAAVRRAESGPVGRPPEGRRVRDMDIDPYLGELDPAAAPEQPTLEGENPFDDVYRAAGLSAIDDPGFTIYKVERLLKSKHIRDLGAASKAASVMVALEASSVSIDEVVQDAIARDKALDQYDAMLRSSLTKLEEQTKQKNQHIEEEIAAYLEAKRKEIAENNDRVSEARSTYESWSRLKLKEEHRLFDAISLFVNENPITRD